MGPLDQRSFDKVTKELDQVATAASVAGTSFPKLKQLVNLVQPMHDALVGSRPEVKKIRKRLRLALHNLRRAPKDARAVTKMRELLVVVEDLRKLVQKDKLGNVPETVEEGPFQVINVWGYNEAELKVLLLMLRRARRLVEGVGLQVDTLPVFADPREMRRVRGARHYVLYNWTDDVLVANPISKPSGDLEAVLEALAARFWHTTLTDDDREVWRGGGLSMFATAFGRKLASGRADSDTDARLAVTIGRKAQRWPSVA